jgi:hypothetical protein
MTFFNKKEEVLDVKLTPHGRYLLSIGKLNPSYYCFIDDDILYDSQAGGFTENQNDVNKRIMDDTPRVKTIPAPYGVESNFQKMESDEVSIESMRKIKNERKINLFPNKMGKSSIISTRAPSIHVDSLSLKIKTTSNYYTGSTASLTNITGLTSQTIDIPQLELEPEYNMAPYKLTVGQEPPWETPNSPGAQDNDGVELELYTPIFEDNSYIKITPEVPLMYFKEFNSLNHRENFMIEVYEVEEDGDIPVYKSLKFAKLTGAKIINGILMDDEFSQASAEPVTAPNDEEESKYVSYYFNINVDNNIPAEELCNYIIKAKDNNVYIDEEIVCPDKTLERFNIYGTRVGPNDIERCDD